MQGVGAASDDQHHRGGVEPGSSALDVQELLRPQVGTKPGFGDRVVAELPGQACGQDCVAAMGDIGERAAMDEGRRPFDGLHQVRMNSVLHERCHRSRRPELACQHGFS